MRIDRLCVLILGAIVLVAAGCSEGSRQVTIVNDGFERVKVDRWARVCDASADTHTLAPQETLKANVPSSGEIVWYVIWNAGDEVIGCLAVQGTNEDKQVVFPVSFRVTCP